MSRQRLRAAVVAAVGVVLLAAPAAVSAHALNVTYQRRLPLAVYLAGAALDRRAVVRVRAARRRPRRAAGARRPGTRPAGLAALRAPGDRPDRLDLDRRPGHRSAARARATSRRSSCGSTAGSASRCCRPSSARSGTGSTRSRRSTTSAPGRLRAVGIEGWATRRLPRVRSGAGRRSSGCVFFVWLELVGNGSGTAIAVHRPRRLHRVHAGDDGPVRPRRLAPRRRDVPRLVRAARTGSRRSGSTDDTGHASRRRPFASGLLLPRLDDVEDRDPRRARHRRRSCSTGCPRRQPWFERLRRAGRADQDAPAARRSWG